MQKTALVKMRDCSQIRNNVYNNSYPQLLNEIEDSVDQLLTGSLQSSYMETYQIFNVYGQIVCLNPYMELTDENRECYGDAMMCNGVNINNFNPYFMSLENVGIGFFQIDKRGGDAYPFTVGPLK